METLKTQTPSVGLKTETIIKSFTVVKNRIRNLLTLRLEDEMSKKDWMEHELSNLDDEIDEYRENESDEWDDLNYINNLMDREKELIYGIDRCEYEIGLNQSLLNKLKVKKNKISELEKFCRDYGIPTNFNPSVGYGICILDNQYE